MRRRRLIAFLAALATLSLPASALAIGALDQNQPIRTMWAANQFGLLAQIFTAGKTGLLDTASIWPEVSFLGRTVEIRTVAAGQPTATVLASATVGSSATGAFVDVTFATPASVVAGTQYALAVDSASATNMSLGTAFDVYAGGNLWTFSNIAGTWNGPSNDDLTFRTFVTEAPTLPQPLSAWKSDASATTALLPVALGSFNVDTLAKADAVFKATNCGKPKADALGCLAGQLLAAELNVANGADDCIAGTIDDADALLVSKSYAGPGSYSLTKAQRSEALMLKDALEAYNQGLGCPA